jgi:glycerol uptake facilitator protein
MLGPLIGEIFGTFILILLGDGVVANVGLAPRLNPVAYNWNTITWGWALQSSWPFMFRRVSLALT